MQHDFIVASVVAACRHLPRSTRIHSMSCTEPALFLYKRRK
jgi:hypothetical protein